MGDFVIVQPEAVRGMIQVKQTLSDSAVRKGVKNVVRAKQHLLNVLWKNNPKGWKNGWVLPPSVFTAVVGFADEIGNNTGFYRRLMLQWSVRQRAYDRPNMEKTSMYILPSFIGSLERTFLYLVGRCNYVNQHYQIFDSVLKEENIYIQALLWQVFNVLREESHEMPPFSFPTDMKLVDEFHVLGFTKTVLNQDGTISLHRNDECTGLYYKTEKTNPADHAFHLTCESDGDLIPTGLLNTDLTPQTLFVKHGSTIDEYNQKEWVAGVMKAEKVKKAKKKNKQK